MKIFFRIALFFLCWPFLLKAQIITPRSSYSSDLQRLEVCQAIRKNFVSNRFQTESSIYKELKKSSSENVCSFLDAEDLKMTIAKKLAPYQPFQEKKSRFKPLRRVSRSYSYLSGGESFYKENFRGDITASINGLTENQNGVSLGVGHQMDSTLSSTFNSKHLSLELTPRFSALWSRGFDDFQNGRVTLDQAYGVFWFDQWHLAAGRFPFILGAGDHGGPLFSDNARSKDMILIEGDDDNRLPSFLENLGQYKMSFFLGSMGPESHFDWGYFAGSSYSLKPLRRLELNLTHLMQFGGNGAPDMPIDLTMREFFGFVPGVSQTGRNGSNKITSLSFVFDLPELMGMRFFGDYSIEDNRDSFNKLFVHSSSYRVGSDFLCFLNSCKNKLGWSLTLTSPIAYRHSTFKEGWTLNDYIIGDSLGPDGFRAITHWEHDWSASFKSNVLYSYTDRSSNLYADYITHIDVLSYGIPEKRHKWVLEQKFNHKLWEFSASVGYEFIKQYQFVSGKNQNSVLLGLGAVKNF